MYLFSIGSAPRWPDANTAAYNAGLRVCPSVAVWRRPNGDDAIVDPRKSSKYTLRSPSTTVRQKAVQVDLLELVLADADLTALLAGNATAASIETATSGISIGV